MPESNNTLVKEDDFKMRNNEQITRNAIPNSECSSLNFSTISFTCNICGRTMKNSSWLNAHIFAGHDKQRPNCSLCSYSIDTRRTLTQHIKMTHFKTYISKCSQCGVSFTTKENKLGYKDKKKIVSKKIKLEERKRTRKVE